MSCLQICSTGLMSLDGCPFPAQALWTQSWFSGSIPDNFEQPRTQHLGTMAGVLGAQVVGCSLVL